MTVTDLVSCSDHNATTELSDVMSRDVAGQSIYLCDDDMSGVGTLPPVKDVDVRPMSGPWPAWLESVDSYRRCQLSYGVYAWRLLLALTAVRVATNVERSMPNHDVRATAIDNAKLDNVDRSSRRFHPYLL